MHRRIRLGGFCGPIAVTSQGMRDVNCWAAFFQRKIPMMIMVLGILGEACLSSSSDVVAENKGAIAFFSFAIFGLWESS